LGRGKKEDGKKRVSRERNGSLGGRRVRGGLKIRQERVGDGEVGLTPSFKLPIPVQAW